MSASTVEVKFYQITKKTNSTQVPDSSTSVTGTYICDLIEPFDILKPTLKMHINTEKTPVQPETTMYSWNYVKIAEFNRYYYVVNHSYSQGFHYFHLECDYLASWKSSIGSSSQFVVRASNEHDEYLIDPMAKAQSNKLLHKIGVTWLDNSSWQKIDADKPVLRVKFNAYAIQTTGSAEVNMGLVLTAMSLNDFYKILTYVTTVLGTEFVEKYFVSVDYCPLYDSAIENNNILAKLRFDSTHAILFGTGAGEINANVYHLGANSNSSFELEFQLPLRESGDPSWQYSHVGRSVFLSGQPFGRIELDADAFQSYRWIHLKFILDSFTGNTKVMYSLYSAQQIPVTGWQNVYFTTVNTFAKVPYAVTNTGNVSEKLIQLTLSGVKLATAITTGIASAGSSLALAGATTAATSAASEAASATNDYASTFGPGGPKESWQYGQLESYGNMIQAQMDSQLYSEKLQEAQAKSSRTNANLYFMNQGINTFSGAVDALVNANRTSSVQSLGSCDTTAGDNPLEIIVEDTIFSAVASAAIGRPLCRQKTISSIAGYVKCESPIFPMKYGMTLNENNLIRAALASGIYYE